MADINTPNLTPPIPEPGTPVTSPGFIPQRLMQEATDLSSVQNAKELYRLSKETARERHDELDYVRKLKDAEIELAKVRERGIAAFAQEMRHQGMTDAQGNYIIPGRVPEEDRSVSYRELEQNIDNPRLTEELKEKMALRGKGGAADTSAFRVKELFGHLASGNIGGAVGELMQPIRGISGPQGPSKMAGLGRLAVGALTRPAFIFGAEQALTRANNLQLELQRSGMQAGLEGGAARAEGLRARADAFSQGINPFDMLSRRMAAEIASGVRSEGFTGTVASAWTDSVGDVVKDLGIGATEALESMKVAVNQLGMSTSEFRRSMENLDTVAKDTSLSVAMVAKNAQQLQLLEAGKGGTSAGLAATAASAAIDRALNPEGLARMPISASGGTANFVGGIQPYLAQKYLGVPAPFANTAEVVRQLPLLLDKLADDIMKIKASTYPDMPLETWASFFYTSGLSETFLPGMDAVDIRMFLERAGGHKMRDAVKRTIDQDVPGHAEAAKKQASSRGFRDMLGKPFGGRTPTERLIAGHRALTNSLAQSLMAADTTVEERQAILRPLWNDAPKESDSYYDRRAREQREQEAIKATQQLLIGLTPEASRLLTPDKQWTMSTTGQTSTVGSQRAPKVTR